MRPRRCRATQLPFRGPWAAPPRRLAPLFHPHLTINISPSPPPAISVLIRTFNSEKTLATVLEALDFAADDRCIVVDSGSTDHTLEIAAKHGAEIIRLSTPFNYSRSLNAGFAAATTDWVIVLSSHCIPLRPDLMARMREAAADAPPDVAVLYGCVSLFDPDPQPPTVTYGNLADWQARRFPGGGNGFAMYPRKMWQSQQFDESLVTAEDMDWLRWTLTAGNRAGLVRDAIVLYRNQGSVSHMFVKGWHEVRLAASIRGGAPPTTASRLRAVRSAAINSLYLGKLLVQSKLGFRAFIKMQAHGIGASLAYIAAPSRPPVEPPRTTPMPSPLRYLKAKIRSRAAIREKAHALAAPSTPGVSCEDFTASRTDPTAFYLRAFQEFHRALPAELRAHREYFVSGRRGFGEDAFHTLWWHLVSKFRPSNFLEIGVYRGQTLSLVSLIARMQGIPCQVCGISPFSSAGDSVSNYDKGLDYRADTLANFAHFDLPTPELVQAYSTDPEALAVIASRSWDIIYIDGNHDYEIVIKDWAACSKAVPTGGLIVLDDSGLNSAYQPPAFATGGHPGPSRLAAEIDPAQFQEILQVGHNRVFRKLA